jgi:Putative beta-barrel porin-2, OmpL-like. bbp2
MSNKWRSNAVKGVMAVAMTAAAFGVAQNASAQAQVTAKSVPCDPYAKYDCLDSYLGDGFWNRLTNYYKLEMGKDAAPADPSAPPTRGADFPPAAMTTPPMPFTEWPNGGNPGIGVTTPNMVDSPFMNAIANTTVGQWMIDNHIQAYGWANAGFNFSTSNTHGGNAPAAYDYNPNVPVLNQIVEYVERLPDTVQKEHNDWGFRLNMIYGQDYRYTTSYGIFSGQLMNKNMQYGFDAVMAYFDYFIPSVAQGLNIRVGRYIAIPDIEAQLAPNNYMYSHSITYGYDNYTNEGILGTLALDKNWQVQAGVTAGTDTTVQHMWTTNTVSCSVLYPCKGARYDQNTGMSSQTQGMLQDPGAKPSFTGAIRWNSDDGKTSVQGVVNGINSGQWGYNNLQWHGLTFYHTFDEHWHISTEFYNEFQKNVPNAQNSQVQQIYANGNGATAPGNAPFSQFAYNAPNLAACGNATALTCRAMANGSVTYINYQIDPMNNLSFRPEFYWDSQGQRTGAVNYQYGTAGSVAGAIYRNYAFGWQHWFSPQIEVRPEVAYYTASNPVFNNGLTRYQTVWSGDIIWHW